MPLKSPDAVIAKLSATMKTAADAVVKSVERAARGELQREFRDSIDPDGNSWKARADGKPALVSKKLPGAFTSKIVGNTIVFVGRVARDWLRVQSEGHSFPSRNVAARATVLRFDRKGRMVKAKRFEKIKKGRAVFARAHTIGRRTLPARPIVPGASLPARWETAIKFATLETLNRSIGSLAK